MTAGSPRHQEEEGDLPNLPLQDNKTPPQVTGGERWRVAANRVVGSEDEMNLGIPTMMEENILGQEAMSVVHRGRES